MLFEVVELLLFVLLFEVAVLDPNPNELIETVDAVGLVAVCNLLKIELFCFVVSVKLLLLLLLLPLVVILLLLLLLMFELFVWWFVLFEGWEEEITDDAFCEIAENAEAAKLALAWALEAIVVAFLNWLDGK